MNIDKINFFQKNLNTNIKNINNKIIKRNRKINLKDIIYGSIYKTINNTSYDDVTYQINKIFININTTFVKKKIKQSCYTLQHVFYQTFIVKFIYSNSNF